MFLVRTMRMATDEHRWAQIDKRLLPRTEVRGMGHDAVQGRLFAALRVTCGRAS
jgi:hypothetical protein